VGLRVDLTRVPPEESALVPLLLSLQDCLEDMKLDPTFIVTPAGRFIAASCPALARTVFET
jgi:hypothetical protein